MIETTTSFSEIIQTRSGEPVRTCYFCQKCTVGCPVAYVMDYQPAQVVRLILLGRKDTLLRSTAPWLCVGCEACGTRCPNGIRLSPIMDVLKEMALEEGVAPAEKKVYALHRAFLDSIKLWGRVHELSMLAEYKLRAMDIFTDLDMGMLLMLKGKIPMLPERIKHLARVRNLYRRAGR
ncbi:MAG: 4Fe-4S dicluster domain-containing protein [Chloroflexota bacterium]|nr:4Fe-4S dicluster domain-containing protein [Chloroflexota bacterium]